MLQLKSKLLYLGTVWPEPTSSAAGMRTEGLIHDFARLGYEIHFASPSKEKPIFLKRLQERGVHTHEVSLNDSSFDQFLQELNPKVVVYDRFILEEQFGWRVKENVPQAMQILDLQDLHSLRRAREKALLLGGFTLATSSESNLQQAVSLFSSELSEDVLRELASIYRCDLTLVISPFEMELLQKALDVPEFLLYVHGYSYETQFVETEIISKISQDKEHLVMIGNFRHPPNEDAVIWLKEEIWPQLRKKIPQVQVHLYGAYPSKKIMGLHHPESGFLVLGPVADSIATLKKYRISLAPLRFGAGIKGKIADSWAAGTPVITTPIGAEGMEDQDGSFSGEIAFSASDFIEKVIRLYSSWDRLEDYRKRGLNSLRTHYDSQANHLRFNACLQDHLAYLKEMRRKNLTGQILSLANLKNTKYFSKWIELKIKQQTQKVK